MLLTLLASLIITVKRNICYKPRVSNPTRSLAENVTFPLTKGKVLLAINDHRLDFHENTWKHFPSAMFKNWSLWESLQFVLCPCTGHPEVIWFINDGVRSALLHPRAVCSNGFLWMERSHGGLRWNTGSGRSSHPVQFHSGIARMPLGSLIEPLISQRGGISLLVLAWPWRQKVSPEWKKTVDVIMA